MTRQSPATRDDASLPASISLRSVALVSAALALIAYLLTLGPTFGFLDKGELAAAASTLGIPHPTGYPTVMLLGYLVTLVAPVRDVVALNILAALLTAAGVGVMTLLLDHLLARLHGTATGNARGTKGDSERPTQAGPRALYAGLVALAIGLTATWWNQGNGFEVYALHALFMPLVTLLYLRWVDAEAAREASAPAGFTRRGFWFALVLGLSFTNHLTTVLLAPAFLLYYFWTLGLSARALRRLVYLIPGFLLGLLPYVWLPIRAAMTPPVNWGYPATFERFIAHVTGKVFQNRMFTAGETFEQQTSYFFRHLPGELAWVGVPLVLIGIWVMMRRSLPLGIWSALLFVCCVIYAGGFEIVDIESYYLTAFFALGIWAAAGLLWVDRRFGRVAALAVAAAMVIHNGVLHYRAADESGNYLAEDMTVNMLTTLPQNSLVLSSQFIFWVGGSWYLQFAESMRPDVVVIYEELFPYPWYIDHLTARYPELMASVAVEADLFRAEVARYEADPAHDGRPARVAYLGMVNALIQRSIAARPIFVTGDLDPAIGADFVRTPYYLALRLMPNDIYLPQEFPSYRFRFWEGRVDSYAAKVYELYARSLYGRALYEEQFGNRDLARRYYDYMLTFDPGYTPENVPDLPLNAEDQVMGTAQFFQELRGLSGRP